MSFRPRVTAKPAQSGHAAAVMDTIKNAQIAHTYWLKSNNANIGAKSTWVEAGKEMVNPWKLEFHQDIVSGGQYGGYEIQHIITLKGGVFTRLQGMVDSISKKMEPFYQSNKWIIKENGKIYMVCTDSSRSTAEWVFTTTAKNDPKLVWVMPGGLTDPLWALRKMFDVPIVIQKMPPVVLNDVTYSILPPNTSNVTLDFPGMVFTIARASPFTDNTTP